MRFPCSARAQVCAQTLSRPAVARFLLAALLLAPGAAMALVPDGLPPEYRFDGVEKVIDSGFLLPHAVDGGEFGVLVLMTGADEYEGRILADEPEEMARLQAEIRERQQVVIDRLAAEGFEVTQRYENILGFAGRTTFQGVSSLAAMDDIEWIEEDKLYKPHLAQGLALMDAYDVRSNFAGEGVAIAIVDSGVDYNHSKLGGGGFPNDKVIGGYDFGEGDPDPMDQMGHGTGVAGIAAGDLPSGPVDYAGGVAHAAKIYALKATNAQGWFPNSATIAAWDWTVSHKNDDPNNPILISNNSWGGGYARGFCDGSARTFANALNNMVANGITVFAASGNDGFCDGMGSPACLENIVSVGSVFDGNIGSNSGCVDAQSCVGFSAGQCPSGWACSDSPAQRDVPTCYSNSASFLTLLAPSENAYTTARGGGYWPDFGGTSGASPYAAGAGAVLQSYALWLQGAPYTPGELETILVSTGDPVTDPKNGITKPRINLGAAAEPAENCSDGADNDGDTLRDCADPDCTSDRDGDTYVGFPCGGDCDDRDDTIWGTPPEVERVYWEGRFDILWDDVRSQTGPGTVYQVVRGRVSDLAAGGSGEMCLAGSANDRAVDWGPRVQGDPLYYLVRGVNSCPDAAGPWGYSALGAERLPTVCPAP